MTDTTHKRHDDVVIQRRFSEHVPTRLVTQVYAVTYPEHTDRGIEQATYADAEHLALARAERQGVSAWYEETPNSERRVLLKSFRVTPPTAASGPDTI
jgi:Mor family transcriptional regulator